MTLSTRAVEAAARAIALADLDDEAREAVNLDMHMARVGSHYQELAQASAALAVDGLALQGWQTIDSAPKDGTKVDIWSAKFGRHTDARYSPGEYAVGVPWGWSSPWMGRITDATHRQPLPAPPAPASTDGKVGP